MDLEGENLASSLEEGKGEETSLLALSLGGGQNYSGNEA